MDMLGFGLKDAPWAWSIRLTRELVEVLGMKPTRADRQIFVLFVVEQNADGSSSSFLVLMISTHVDDLKTTGRPPNLVAFLAHMEKTFGKLSVQLHVFDHCGIRHIQDVETFEITCHQDDYIRALRPIDQAEVYKLADDELADVALHGLFFSLLGGVAWTLMTRGDVAVYGAALQRVASAPKATHKSNQ